MLQLTRQTDYGLRLMLAVGASGGVTTADVARSHGIPYQFLRKAVAPLVAQGLLTSRRGFTGGLTLARPAETITALDIVRAFGQPSLNECTVDPTECDRRATCAGFGLWYEAQAALERVLRNARLSDMIRKQAALQRPEAPSKKRRDVRPSRWARSKSAGQHGIPLEAVGEGGNPQ